MIIIMIILASLARPPDAAAPPGRATWPPRAAAAPTK